MTNYLDTSAPGGSPLTASGQVKSFGSETSFYISVASNIILRQSTGPSVQFLVYSKKSGREAFNVDYGTTNANFSVEWSGYLVEAVVPSGHGSVNCRVVIASQPTPIALTTVGSTVTSSQVISLFNKQSLAVTANSQIFGVFGSLIPSNPPCIFRVQACFDTAGVLSLLMGTGGGVSPTLNSGNPLVAGALYIFDVEVDSGDAFNLAYSVNANALILKVEEVDAQS